MNTKIFTEWLFNLNESMKKKEKKDNLVQAVTDGTIRNTFDKAGFAFENHYDTISSISDHSIISPSSDYSAVSLVDDEQGEALKILDDLLQHVMIGGQRMNASDFVDMNEDMPAFNLWYDDCERLLTTDLIEVDDDELPDETDFPSTETPPKISEVMEMLRKLHLLAIAQHPQLHPIINQLESQITDIYVSSKSKRQTVLDDFLGNN